MKLSKKIIAMLLCTSLVAAMGITGCSKSEQPAPEPQQQEPQQEQSSGMANPMTEYSSLDEINALNGGGLIKIFPDATDEKFFGIDNGDVVIAQYDFKVGDREFTFRCAPVQEDISGQYLDGKTMFYDSEAFKGMQERYTSEVYVGRWFAGDMQYTLSCTHGEEQGEYQEEFDKLVLETCKATGGDTNNEIDPNADYTLKK